MRCVIDRWKGHAGQEDPGTPAWSQGTRTIRAIYKGAHGEEHRYTNRVLMCISEVGVRCTGQRSAMCSNRIRCSSVRVPALDEACGRTMHDDETGSLSA